MKSFQTISIPLLWWTTNQDGGRENKSRRLLTNHSLFYLVLYVRSLPLKVCEDGQLVLFLTLESVCFSTVDTKERERDKQSLGWTFSKGCSSVAVKSGNFISFNFIWVEINWICSPPSNDIYVYIFLINLIFSKSSVWSFSSELLTKWKIGHFSRLSYYSRQIQVCYCYWLPQFWSVQMTRIQENPDSCERKLYCFRTIFPLYEGYFPT